MRASDEALAAATRARERARKDAGRMQRECRFVARVRDEGMLPGALSRRARTAMTTARQRAGPSAGEEAGLGARGGDAP